MKRFDDIEAAKTGVILLVSVLIIAITMAIVSRDRLTALDVYRGKTTLEITYRDSVAIDSTVVYKVK